MTQHLTAQVVGDTIFNVLRLGEVETDGVCTDPALSVFFLLRKNMMIMPVCFLSCMEINMVIMPVCFLPFMEQMIVFVYFCYGKIW